MVTIPSEIYTNQSINHKIRQNKRLIAVKYRRNSLSEEHVFKTALGQKWCVIFQNQVYSKFRDLSILIAMFKYVACFESSKHTKKHVIGQILLGQNCEQVRLNMRNKTLLTIEYPSSKML